MYKIIKFFLFCFSPEKAHLIAMTWLKVLCGIPGGKKLLETFFCVENKQLEKSICGLKFNNPVGLAAGFDKDAKYINELSALGFGFIEIGTLTPKPQSGNEKPRLFRIPQDNALINRMGFNNEGAVVARERLKNRPKNIIVGGNIGKNKITPNTEAVNDYLFCFNELYDVVDYFAVNVSSPNTPNLRALQEKEPLKNLLFDLQKLNNSKNVTKPIFLKIAPDLSNEQLDDVVEIIIETGIAGVIATNTTISRDNLNTSTKTIEYIGNGGLSGMPLTKRATDVIRYIAQKSNKSFPIIGVGGIHSPEDAVEKLNAGADLIQVYTGFIYEGPQLIKKINIELLKRKHGKNNRMSA
jgi:dihydroorotate dehydrogenase